MAQFWNRIKHIDWILFLTTLLLVCLGLVLIYSTSLGSDATRLANFRKQIGFVAIGFIIYFFFSAINYRALKAFARWFYIFGILLLVSVLFLGSTIRGTRGWFNFGFFLFQPVEVIKLIAIIFLAAYFNQRARQVNQLRHIFVSGMGILLFFGLIMLQPDFGSASVMFLVWLLLLLTIGVKRRYLIVMVLGLSLSLFVGWNYVLKPYQKDRISVFLNPTADPLGSGYNLTQSIVAVGSGELMGKGLGFGSQSQLRFLPESQTDFIFAVLAEELGLAGVALLLVLFALLFYRLIKAAMRAPDDFGLFLVVGIMFSLFIQAFLNMAMNMGLVPVTGISLPLISYGGSYLMITLAMLGIAQSVVVSSKLFSPTHSIE